MAESTGIVLAAGGIALANEAIFAPLAGSTSYGVDANKPGGVNINWRIIPATVILALIFGGVEKASPAFGMSLAGLTLMAVLILPVGNAPTPIDNIVKALGL